MTMNTIKEVLLGILYMFFILGTVIWYIVAGFISKLITNIRIFLLRRLFFFIHKDIRITAEIGTRRYAKNNLIFRIYPYEGVLTKFSPYCYVVFDFGKKVNLIPEKKYHVLRLICKFFIYRILCSFVRAMKLDGLETECFLRVYQSSSERLKDIYGEKNILQFSNVDWKRRSFSFIRGNKKYDIIGASYNQIYDEMDSITNQEDEDKRIKRYIKRMIRKYLKYYILCMCE